MLLMFFPTQALKRQYSKAGLAAGGYLALFFCKGLIADNGIIKKIGQFTNHDPQDLTAGTLLGSFLWGSSYLVTNQQMRTFLRGFAITPPLISLVTPSIIWKKIGRIPLLRQYFILSSYLGYIPLGSFNTCSNKDCEGICNRCKIRRMYQTLPLAVGIYKLGQWGHHKLFPTEFEKEAKESLIGKQCKICLEVYTAEQEPIRLECLHHMCKSCAQQTYFQHRQQETSRVPMIRNDNSQEFVTIVHENNSCRCKDCKPTCPECRHIVNTEKLITQLF